MLKFTFVDIIGTSPAKIMALQCNMKTLHYIKPLSLSVAINSRLSLCMSLCINLRIAVIWFILVLTHFQHCTGHTGQVVL